MSVGTLLAPQTELQPWADIYVNSLNTVSMRLGPGGNAPPAHITNLDENTTSTSVVLVSGGTLDSNYNTSYIVMNDMVTCSYKFYVNVTAATQSVVLTLGRPSQYSWNGSGIDNAVFTLSGASGDVFALSNISLEMPTQLQLSFVSNIPAVGGVAYCSGVLTYRAVLA